LHGHAFQVVSRSEEEAGAYDASTAPPTPQTPMRRDTVLVRPNGNVVLRFKADNPGIWLFHCHIEWHVASGLVATMIEDPVGLQQQLSGKIPKDHLDACKASNQATEGNAAGNTVDLLDLSGENKSPAAPPAGFTARGIVALVFSCIAAFLGLGVISWYGIQPVKAKTV
jgi:iron transport multicopper oxidase